MGSQLGPFHLLLAFIYGKSSRLDPGRTLPSPNSTPGALAGERTESHRRVGGPYGRRRADGAFPVEPPPRIGGPGRFRGGSPSRIGGPGRSRD
jgi:hypothetical protein